jgi:SAM-dependent methyltransferase
MATISDRHQAGHIKHEVSAAKMPGHWVLASLGKRVLRPGGLELTHRMLAALDVGSKDDVVEFAPGLGVTARFTLSRGPASYVAVERDAKAAQTVRQLLNPPQQSCVLGSAEDTGLANGCASVVYGEAMLSMQPATTKARIVQEAARLLRPGGRYGVHELCLTPDDVDAAVGERIARELSSEIHVGVRPLTAHEWKKVLTDAGLEIVSEATAPMHLLEPRRMVRDEGLLATLRFTWNMAWRPEARKRALAMRKVFRKYQQHLAAIALVARKPEGAQR